MDKEAAYSPLRDSESIDDESCNLLEENKSNLPARRRKTQQTVLKAAGFILPWAIVLALSIVIVRDRVWGSNRFQQTKRFPAQLTYSPAQELVEYQIKVFDQNLEDAAMEYRDPDLVDHTWSDLYNFGMTSISREEARKMTNKTSPIVPGDPDRFIIQLDVFHQLHCLNVLRLAVEPYYGLKNESREKLEAEGYHYPNKGHETEWESPLLKHIDGQHLNHCINSLRQSIMCHSDVSPVVWHWDHPAERVEFNRGFLSVTHTCRNFERIRTWAKERQNHADFDHFVPYEDKDDLDIPTWP